jgi:Flp pilus assembly pilin Flp
VEIPDCGRFLVVRAPRAQPRGVQAPGEAELLHHLSVRLYLLTQREHGQTMAEYAIVLAVISIAIIGAIGLLGTNIKTALSTVASKV